LLSAVSIIPPTFHTQHFIHLVDGTELQQLTA